MTANWCLLWCPPGNPYLQNSHYFHASQHQNLSCHKTPRYGDVTMVELWIIWNSILYQLGHQFQAAPNRRERRIRWKYHLFIGNWVTGTCTIHPLFYMCSLVSASFLGPIFLEDLCTQNHLLKNLFPSRCVQWVGNLLILKWSKKEGMMDICHHEIPTIHRSVERWAGAFSSLAFQY